MSLQSLTAHNFRSYKEASFEFSAGVNIIIGPNAVGKTNLLEAVYVACLGKGFRGKQDSDLLSSGSDWARIDANFESSERSVLLKKPDGGRLQKKFIFGGNQKSRLVFDDLQPLVLFQPDDLRLVGGGPERRRAYLDSLLSLLIPSFRQDLLAYERTLLQRNSYLKTQHQETADQLFVWNMQLAELGGRIIRRRLELVERLNKNISRVYTKVAGSKHGLRIDYHISENASTSDLLLRALEKSAHLDRQRGFTSVGPHRDNITFLINNEPFRVVASRGENRTLILALKIIELEEIEQRRQAKPLLLLDDVFSELDGSRRRLLTGYLASHQTLITTTDADVIGKKFTESASMISLQSNSLE